MKFYKTQALGNDFIVLLKNYPLSVNQIIDLCDRRKGIGADGVIIVNKEKERYTITIFNSDGSEALTCGSALRCVGKLINAKTKKKVIKIATLSAIHLVEINEGNVTTTFPSPSYLDPYKMSLNNQEFYLVEVGNYHAMSEVKDVESFDIVEYAKILQKEKHFNLEYYQIKNKNEVIVRFFEYGCGMTTSCTSGTVALYYHLRQSNKIDNECVFHQLGGDLHLSQDEGVILINGEAKIVYKGEIVDGSLKNSI